eukprot:2322473-Heterocapsa_arctica.AAC.1
MGIIWGDAAKGRLILCSSASEDLLGPLTEVAMHRVPKWNPDRTLSAKAHFVWDGRVPNARCPKEDHPVAGQP